MLESILYTILAILGLGFLVFIHELGHFFIARRQGMRIEAFSIGFGKPLYSWEKDGVKWMIGMLPFGGYVRIAGMQREGGVEPAQISDGFYGKRPWQRIKVALAGPLVNIVFALAIFTVLWLLGGRNKQFAEFTHRIGWVDPQSALYQLGVRPGDVIQRYDGRPFHGFKDLLVASLMSDKTTRIEGYKVDYATGKRYAFDYTLSTYENLHALKEKLHTIGVASPASYLIFDPSEIAGLESPSMKTSGIEKGDRVIWADGEVVFSVPQLSALINESSALLTVQRRGQIFQTKVPRIPLDDLRLASSERAEIGDWQYEAGLPGKLPELFFIPYNLSPSCAVESRIDFIEEAQAKSAFQKCQRCTYFTPLEEGDLILAVDGTSVHSAYQILEALQTRRVVLIVERGGSASMGRVSWEKGDAQFDDFNPDDLNALVSSIGTERPIQTSGSLRLLRSITPVSRNDFATTAEQKAATARGISAAKKEIESIQDPEKRNFALKQLEERQNKLILGLSLHDRMVRYNPNPLQQFQAVLEDTWRTLSGLFSGLLSPKYVSGPVGILHVVHQSWMVGAKEALFWMAVISLNLGIMNLLPVPVLDGGHIVFSLFEMVTRRPLKAKTMERLVIPFVGLLIAFFVYVTYQDIARLFSYLF
ncbi:MAG: site-2 protease family protein [Chlamydiia bacterium]|nr:site-2 protease family protein [Chlamydiia bacterium]